MLKKIPLFFLFSALLWVISCQPKHKTQRENSHIYNVSLKTDVLHLYYIGNIKPIREELIMSPASGVVNKMEFHYGDYVKKGQLLLRIHSPEMENDFREAISSYLRTKQVFLNSKKSMEGTNDLYQEKIISEQEYFNEQNQYQNNVLSFIEATNKMKQLLSYLPTAKQTVFNMSLSEIADVKKLFQNVFEDLTLYARNSGIVLFPQQNSESIKLIQVGYEVKKNDALLVIGDLSGVAITANISELDINHLQPGHEVLITFQAQPELELQGKIISVARQAKVTENTGFSTFPVLIQVGQLSHYQIQKIRVGMSAKIDIMVEGPPTIKVPIKAVYQQDNKNWVTLLDPTTQQAHDIPVETGMTSLDEVTITRGLKPNDKIIFHD